MALGSKTVMSGGGDKGQKNRLRKAGIKVGLSSSLTPVKINCGESSTSLESSFVTDVEENTVEHIDDSESVDMSLDASSICGDESATVEDSSSARSPMNPPAPSTSSLRVSVPSTPLQSCTNTPRSSARKS